MGDTKDAPAAEGTQDTLHGETAARRQAITELLFFAAIGDLHRCRRITARWGLALSDPKTADYDRRTPLHLASAEGCHSVAVWLISQGADVNAIDRFHRTPLEDAVREDCGEVATFLIQSGGKVLNKDNELIELSESPLAGNVRMFTGYDPDWEVDPGALKILEKIGEGEFGVVHKARWLGTIVAVKVLKDSGVLAMGDFRTELNVLQKVHHPHTVQFLGAVTKHEPYMILTEYMTGGSLLDLFRLNTSLPLWRSIQVAMDCARGMAYLHNRTPHAVVHRDLKPANIMLGGPKVFTPFHTQILHAEMGVLKIADFGLSKSLKLAKPKKDVSLVHSRPVPSASPKRGSPTEPNKDPSVSAMSVASLRTPSYKLTGETGSYRYMAPEVFRHEQYNNKVDVYSFAMIAYQLFEGMPPFNGMDPVAAVKGAALEGTRPQWGINRRADRVDVPPRVRALVESCWHGDPDARPEFEDVVQQLEAIGKGFPPVVSKELQREGCVLQ